MSQVTVLTETDLRAAAPSIFSVKPIAGVSDKYAFIPTIAVIDGLRQRGLVPVSARQSRSRLPDRSLFAQHVVRLRPEAATLQVGDVFYEIVLTNSHDRSSAYRITAGLFRLWCANGAVASVGAAGHYAIRHTGDVVGEVIDATYRVLDDAPQITGKVEEFTKIDLSGQERTEFAQRAAQIRWGDKPLAKPWNLLESRRPEDHGNDLWRVFNRVQENIVRGGVRYERINEETQKVRRFQTRPISGVQADLDFNKRLWDLAEEVAGTRGA
jgi:hypothetical protein